MQCISHTFAIGAQVRLAHGTIAEAIRTAFGRQLSWAQLVDVGAAIRVQCAGVMITLAGGCCSGRWRFISFRVQRLE